MSSDKCITCGDRILEGNCVRCGRPFVHDPNYANALDRLAREVVNAAIVEGSFEVFWGEPVEGSSTPLTPLQRAISELARSLKFWHYPGDGCVDEH